MKSSTELPDILIIVLDSLRADTIHSLAASNRAENIWRDGKMWNFFPNAIAPAPWTIPSHSSLFTGRYPFEHHTHWRGSVELSPDFTTLAEHVRSVGYATASFSENELVSPSFGLTRGFERAYWKSDNQLTALGIGHEASTGSAEARNSHVESTGRGLAKSLLPLAEVGERVPLMIECLCRLQRFRKTLTHTSQEPSSNWVEHRFVRWLHSQPASKPLFGFVNLMNCHEPYFMQPESINDVLSWLKLYTVRQDKLGWLRGDWFPSERELEVLTSLYNSSARTACHRASRFVSLLDQNRPRRNPLVFVTSDHGQAFGEGGHLYHGLSLEDAVVRIPLFVRGLDVAGGPQVTNSLTSLIDIFPTIEERVGTPGNKLALPGRALDELVKAPRPDGVYCIGDGLSEFEVKRLHEKRLLALDRVGVAVYIGATKHAVFARRGIKNTFSFDTSLMETSPGLPRPVFSELASLLSPLIQARSDCMSARVRQRLERWGYF